VGGVSGVVVGGVQLWWCEMGGEGEEGGWGCDVWDVVGREGILRVWGAAGRAVLAACLHLAMPPVLWLATHPCTCAVPEMAKSAMVISSAQVVRADVVPLNTIRQSTVQVSKTSELPRV